MCHTAQAWIGAALQCSVAGILRAAWESSQEFMMKPVSAADGPRAEVSGALPAVPPPTNVDRLTREAVAASLAALRAAAKDDAGAKAALAMLGGRAEALDELASQTDGGAYALAVRLDGAGDAAGAAAALAVLAGMPGSSEAGYLGLAVLATRAASMDLVEALVAPCLAAEDRHPRACSVAGIMELARGNRQGAQAWLAAASRVARRRPEYRAELQLAQRALLLMHLG